VGKISIQLQFFRLSERCSGQLRSTRMWCRVNEWFVREVWRQCGNLIFKVQEASLTPSPLKMGPIGCPETSVTDYQSTLHNIPEGRRCHLQWGGSLKSRKKPCPETSGASLPGTMYHIPEERRYQLLSSYRLQQSLCFPYFLVNGYRTYARNDVFVLSYSTPEYRHSPETERFQKRIVSIVNTGQLTLCREVVCIVRIIRSTYTLCRKYTGLNAAADGTNNYHWALFFNLINGATSPMNKGLLIMDASRS
jgi:hypothetical protein